MKSSRWNVQLLNPLMLCGNQHKTHKVYIYIHNVSMPSIYIYIYLAHLAKPPCTYVNGSCTFRNSKPTVQLNTKPLPWYEGAILPKSQNTIYNSFGQNSRPKQEKQAVSILRFPISRHSIKYSLHTQSRISASNTLGRDSQITIYQFQPIDPLEHFVQGIDATITLHIGGLGCWQPEGVGYGHNSRFNPNDLFFSMDEPSGHHILHIQQLWCARWMTTFMLPLLFTQDLRPTSPETCGRGNLVFCFDKSVFKGVHNSQGALSKMNCAMAGCTANCPRGPAPLSCL